MDDGMDARVNAAPGTGTAARSDQERLHELGYAQELKRGMGAFSNFAVSFTIISILSGCLTLYYFGMQHGGPPTMLWGWLLVGGLVLVVGLAMAEVCSSYPTAGGLYYWAAKLAPSNGSCVCARATRSSGDRGTWAGGAGRSAPSRSSGSSSSRSCSCCRRPARSP